MALDIALVIVLPVIGRFQVVCSAKVDCSHFFLLSADSGVTKVLVRH